MTISKFCQYLSGKAMGHGRPMVLIHKADGCGPKLQLQMICNRHEELQKLQTFCPWHLSGNPDFSLINFVNRSWLRGTGGKEIWQNESWNRVHWSPRELPQTTRD